MSPADRGPGSQPAGPQPAGPLLTARGLEKSFGSTRVLAGIDLAVERGKVLVLIGPSGSGKTTVLRSLNGLETPDAGTLSFAPVADGGPRPAAPALEVDFGSTRLRGRAGRGQRDALRDRSSMVFQHFNLFPHKTVLQNVIEGPVVVQGRPRDEAIADAETLLERVGLAAKRDAYPVELSGGQQQRVGIVRALALRPQLLLFDEPTSALDPELVGDVLTVMSELAAEGWTMVVVTHELSFARQVADEVLFMDGGVVLERGAPGRIFTDPQHDRTRTFLDRLLRPLE